jgi:hypothetical protein
MSILSKLIYRRNEIKISGFSIDTGTLILMVWECKHFFSKIKLRGLTVSEFSEAPLIKRMRDKDLHVDWWKRTGIPQIDSHMSYQLIFDKNDKVI